jgi:hypothetical protein
MEASQPILFEKKKNIDFLHPMNSSVTLISSGDLVVLVFSSVLEGPSALVRTDPEASQVCLALTVRTLNDVRRAMFPLLADSLRSALRLLMTREVELRPQRLICCTDKKRANPCGPPFPYSVRKRIARMARRCHMFNARP